MVQCIITPFSVALRESSFVDLAGDDGDLLGTHKEPIQASTYGSAKLQNRSFCYFDLDITQVQ